MSVLARARAAARRVGADRASTTPIVVQVEEADCGPACLGILLGHRGTPVPAAQLRAECGVSRDGTTAADLIRAAAKYGLSGKGVRLRSAGGGTGSEEVMEALRALTRPLIILIRGSHFVVLEAVAADGTVAINDPGRGRYRQSGRDFRTEFSGIALTFAGESNGPAGRVRRPWVRTCWAWLGPAHGSVALAALLGLVGGLLLDAEALVLGRTATGVAAGDRASGPALVTVLGISVAVAAAGFGQRRLLTSVLAKVSTSRARDVTDRILALPTRFTLRRPIATLLGQIRFAETAAVLLTHKMVPLLAGVAFAAPLVGLLCWLSPVLLLAAAIGAAAAGALRWTGDRRAAESRRLLTNEVTRRNALAHGALSRMAAMHAEGSDADLFAELTGLQVREAQVRDHAAAQVRPWQVVATAVETAIVAAACALAARTITSGTTAFGHAVGAITVLVPLLVTARTVVGALQELPGFVGRFAILDDVTDAVPEPRYRERAVADLSVPRLEGRVELVDLAFGYAPNRPPLLDGVTARLSPGRRVVLLGAPGCGKSTLLRLLIGALEPSRGRVLLDGRLIHEVPRGVLLASVGYVPQTPRLFPASVAENVTLFDEGIDAERVARALRDAGLDEVVARRGGPAVAEVAPDGRNFGGGERQRLSLARALVRDPSILVLDEPVSAVDPSLAARLDASLRRRGVTTVVVTQRTEMVGPDDLVLTLKNGRLIPGVPARAAGMKLVRR